MSDDLRKVQQINREVRRDISDSVMKNVQDTELRDVVRSEIQKGKIKGETARKLSKAADEGRLNFQRQEVDKKVTKRLDREMAKRIDHGIRTGRLKPPSRSDMQRIMKNLGAG